MRYDKIDMGIMDEEKVIIQDPNDWALLHIIHGHLQTPVRILDSERFDLVSSAFKINDELYVHHIHFDQERCFCGDRIGHLSLNDAVAHLKKCRDDSDQWVIRQKLEDRRCYAIIVYRE